MTTDQKLNVCIITGMMALGMGIYAFVAKRIDDRSEEEHQAMMKYYERNYGIVVNDQEDE